MNYSIQEKIVHLKEGISNILPKDVFQEYIDDQNIFGKRVMELRDEYELNTADIERNIEGIDGKVTIIHNGHNVGKLLKFYDDVMKGHLFKDCLMYINEILDTCTKIIYSIQVKDEIKIELKIFAIFES